MVDPVSPPPGLAGLTEMRHAFAAVGDAPGGREVAATALAQRLAPIRLDIAALLADLAPMLEQLGRAHLQLVAIDHRLDALVALAVATGRYDSADDPPAAAMAALQIDSGWDRLLGELAGAGVEPT
jgi:hypothetical protein